MLRLNLTALLIVACLLPISSYAAEPANAQDKPRNVVLMAGRPSHPPRMHEFNAGVQLLAKCLQQGAPSLKVHVVLNGWPQDEGILTNADAIIFYMDGGKNHEIVRGDGTRIAKLQKLVDRGVGIGCFHYGVEVVADQAGAELKRWIGGHYEHMFSCNPMWEPSFTHFPEHPITRGVKPFQIKDEWYFNMRFVDGLGGDKPVENSGVKFTPILYDKPADAVRNGPYVYPKGPYPHIQEAKGRPEVMMWAIERPDGGRGVGFTGGHFHDNWGNDEFRKVVLNAIVWLAKMDVPNSGIASTITKEDLDANLDPKPPKK